MTGSLPICYNTVISGENLLTGCAPLNAQCSRAAAPCSMPRHATTSMSCDTCPAVLRSMWVNLILGIVIYLGFVAFRGMKGFEFYHARLVRPLAAGWHTVGGGRAVRRCAVFLLGLPLLAFISAAVMLMAMPWLPLPPPCCLQLLPAVSRKPPQLRLHGHQRFWGWLLPVFKVTDEQLVRSAGLDALIGVSVGADQCRLSWPLGGGRWQQLGATATACVQQQGE